MQVGGIGAIGGGLGAGSPLGAAGSTSGGLGNVATTDSLVSDSVVGSLSASATAQVEALLSELQSISSFELLFALLILSAMEKDDDSSGAAAGFLAGLILAGGLSNFADATGQAGPPIQPGQFGLGANLDLLA